MPKKLVILSGPSCVGKGPLRTALEKYHPEIRFAELILCHSRTPRFSNITGSYEVHGKDYYFLPRGLFEQLDPRYFLTVKIRTEYQAIDLVQLEYLFETHDLVLIEAYTTLAGKLIQWAKKQKEIDLNIKTVFLTPLSNEEIEQRAENENKTPEQIVYEVMKEKLIRRGEDPPDKIEIRAKYAYWEIQQSRDYDFRIVNHAGEDDLDQWSDPPGPEASRVLAEFVQILQL